MNSHIRAPRVLSLLLALTALAVWWHLSLAQETPENALVVLSGETRYTVSLDTLDPVHVTGEIVNGRGEASLVRSEGTELRTILEGLSIAPSSIDRIRVIAADSFSATVLGDEMRESGKVYLLTAEESAPRLIVFGDTDRKRNVKNVVQLTLEPAEEAP